jgi:hypothetical protein
MPPILPDRPAAFPCTLGCPARAEKAPGWSSGSLLDVLDVHGAHDLRHTFATWLEGAGGQRGGREGSAVAAIEQRPTASLAVAAQVNW